jgi:lipopolysaccharide transport system ATP-binding protein
VIGHQRAKGDGLRHAIEAAFRSPLKWFIDRKRRVQSMREEVWALRDVTFSINQGDVVGIIGRNGAGKSTLLKILSRITEPTAGRVRIKGRVASLLEVGTGFHPELTGRENIFLNGAILGMSKSEIRRKFDEIVAFSEIDKFLDTPVKRYSSGMYVRLAFAVAAHLDPEILVVDEVLSVGDSAFQKKCAGKMQDASGGGRTVFFVSHNMSAIKVLCTKAILFSEGKLKLIGSPEQCIREYESMDAGQANGTWRRPVSRPLGVLGFKQLAAQVTGQQPNLQLTVDVEFAGSSASQKIILALDIADGIGATIMQALPRVEPFAASGSNNCRFQVVVDLPPLIPGQYSVTAWIGPHNTETFDYIPGAVSFSVSDSPSLGRTYPHTVNHGYVVPPSTLKSLN